MGLPAVPNCSRWLGRVVRLPRHDLFGTQHDAAMQLPKIQRAAHAKLGLLQVLGDVKDRCRHSAPLQYRDSCSVCAERAAKIDERAARCERNGCVENAARMRAGGHMMCGLCGLYSRIEQFIGSGGQWYEIEFIALFC